MTTLTGKTPAATYKDLLQISNANAGIDATLRTIEDGEGTSSTLQLSTTGVNFTGTIQVAGGADKATALGALTGTNTGDQTSIVGITGTKAQFDTACSDGDFLYVGDVTQYTDEMAQDAVGTILTDSSTVDFTYNDGANTITAAVIANTSTQKIEVTKNSGSVVGTRKQLNFIEGSNVTLTIADDAGNDQIDVTIAATGGGGGSSSFTLVEKDLGTNPRRSGKFTITGLAGLTTNKPVNIFQAVGPYTSKGTLADEAEMDGLIVKGIVTAVDTITAYWNSATAVRGNFKFNYLVGA